MELVRSPSTSSVAAAPASVYVDPSFIVTGLSPLRVITGGAASEDRVVSVTVSVVDISLVYRLCSLFKS